jgi:hypothetical protein
VDVLGLAEIAHIEPPAAAGAFHVVFRLGRCGVVDIAAGVARHTVASRSGARKPGRSWRAAEAAARGQASGDCEARSADK